MIVKITLIDKDNVQEINMNYNDTVQTVLDRIGKTMLYNKHGKIMPTNVPIRGDVTLYCDPPPT